MKFQRRYDDGVQSRRLEGKVRGGYDQDILYTYIKYLKNKNNK